MPDIQLYLVSHTNTGKTSLVRTMLGQDVGAVEDEANVTRSPAVFELAGLPHVGSVGLWDTPGFADSFRLARRLTIKPRWWGWPVGWWDWAFNRRLWRNCRLARTLKNKAHVILYLINVLERPVDAIYFKAELEVLTWVGKPVIAILNQGGNQRINQMATEASTQMPSEQTSILSSTRASTEVSTQPPTNVEHTHADLWREALHEFAVVKKILALDSFSRCWLQELDLFDEITSVLPAEVQDDYRKLAVTLREGHFERFEKSVEELAKTLTVLARDRVKIEADQLSLFKQWWRQLKNKLPWRRAKPSAVELASQQLTSRFWHETCHVTDRLIALNRLSGASAGEIVSPASGISISAPPDPSTTGLSGALAGLGGVAIADSYRTRTDQQETILYWSEASLNEALRKFVLLYLSIAHFGRGQGQWSRKTDPENWQTLVQEEVAKRGVRLASLWEKLSLETSDAAENHSITTTVSEDARTQHSAANEGAPSITETAAECATLFREVVVAILLRLYPDSSKYLREK